MYGGDGDEETLQRNIDTARRVLNMLHTLEPDVLEKNPCVAKGNPWALYPPYDYCAKVYPRTGQQVMSCYKVLTRLWQICKNQGLRHQITPATVETVKHSLQYDFLQRKHPLCQAYLVQHTNALGTPNTRSKNLVSGMRNSASNRKKDRSTGNEHADDM